MTIAAFIALSLSVPDHAATAIAALPASECPARSSDDAQGAGVGGRAIIADDGTSIVVQCGDGTIKAWRAGVSGFSTIGRMTLLRAARDRGIVPAGIACPSSEGVEVDCDVVDHSVTGDVYVLRRPDSLDTFIVAPNGAARKTSLNRQFGAIAPGKRGEDVYFVEGGEKPERLRRQALTDGSITTVARLPNPSLLFEDGEGQAGEMAYSAAHRSIIVSFGGAFRVATEMTYVRAFDLSGRERWHVRGALPAREESNIVGAFTRLLVADDGRFALLAKTSDRSTTEMLDLASGKVVATLPGWPIAAARQAPIALVRSDAGGYSLVRLPAVAMTAR